MRDIKIADEAFITSATQFVMPVVKVDNIKIGMERLVNMLIYLKMHIWRQYN